MHAFLFLALPAIILWQVTTHQKFEWKSFVPPLLWGFLFALLLCSVQEFFTLPAIAHPASFAKTFLILFLTHYLVPVAVLCALFFAFSKDSWEYRCAALSPLLGAFFAVSMPYHAITGEGSFTFNLLALPFFTAALTVSAPALAGYAYHGSAEEQKGATALNLLLLLAAVAVPPLFESLAYFGMHCAAYIPLGVTALALSVVLCLRYRKKHERKPIFMTM